MDEPLHVTPLSIVSHVPPSSPTVLNRKVSTTFLSIPWENLLEGDVLRVELPNLQDHILRRTHEPSTPAVSTIRDVVSNITLPNSPPFKVKVHKSPSLEDRPRLFQAKDNRTLFHWHRLGFSAIIAIPTFVIGVVFMGLVPSKISGRHFFLGYSGDVLQRRKLPQAKFERSARLVEKRKPPTDMETFCPLWKYHDDEFAPIIGSLGGVFQGFSSIVLLVLAARHHHPRTIAAIQHISIRSSSSRRFFSSVETLPHEKVDVRSVFHQISRADIIGGQAEKFVGYKTSVMLPPGWHPVAGGSISNCVPAGEAQPSVELTFGEFSSER
ncbi:hypothetical protein BC827DRAFT_1382131 [Russula dissimulans]|nr:hypothetical protein BC827DRAFT_1382131 [Russula dissimulans]